MANELNIAYTPGQTLEAGIYAPGWTQQGVNIALVETPASSGLYVGSVPGTPAIPDGEYFVLFEDVNASNAVIGRGTLFWTADAEDFRSLENRLAADHGAGSWETADVGPLNDLILGGRDIDFTGNDLLGWQRIERNPAGVEVARYNLFDENGARINEAVADFIARAGMISAEVLI